MDRKLSHKRRPVLVGHEYQTEDRHPALLGEYVRKDELAHEFGVSPRTIERWVRLRLLPKPVKLGRSSFHHVPTIREHLLKQASAPARKGR